MHSLTDLHQPAHSEKMMNKHELFYRLDTAIVRFVMLIPSLKMGQGWTNSPRSKAFFFFLSSDSLSYITLFLMSFHLLNQALNSINPGITTCLKHLNIQGVESLFTGIYNLWNSCIYSAATLQHYIACSLEHLVISHSAQCNSNVISPCLEYCSSWIVIIGYTFQYPTLLRLL